MTVDELGIPHTFLQILNRAPGYKKGLQMIGHLRKGENLLARDWDVCIVLDACRVDVLRSVFEDKWVPPGGGDWDTIVSVDSHTIPWTKKTFGTSTRGTKPTVYVTATPQSTVINCSSKITHVDEIWRYGWDGALGTVPPRVVTDRAIHHWRNNTTRVMVHYLQPHVPLLTYRDGELQPRFKSHIGSGVQPPSESNDTDSGGFFDVLPGDWKMADTNADSLFDRLQNGELKRQTVWEAYQETLGIVLEDVTTLLRTVDADRVIITADHGNAFGEWGLYGHPHHMPFSILREVPYLTTSGTAELDYKPDEYQMESETSREEQLAALGYR